MNETSFCLRWENSPRGKGEIERNKLELAFSLYVLV